MIDKKKLLTVIVIVIILMPCSYILAYFLSTRSERYKIALKFVDDNPIVLNNIGLLKSKELGFWDHSVRYKGPHGYAEYRIYVVGENGTGNIHLYLEKSAGIWKVVKGNLILENGVSIPLLLNDK